MIVKAPVSLGELVDKISILKIKQVRIKDPAKLANVNFEHDALYALFDDIYENIPASRQPSLVGLSVKLKMVNERIWDIEDGIRECEKNKDFGPNFITFARGVYHNNDERAALKREINDLVGSQIVEEKSYTDYKG